MKPYYDEDGITIYHGDCREILPCLSFDSIVTDPPYPNNGQHFLWAVSDATALIRTLSVRHALVFWTELLQPPVPLPLVAVHIWHRTNVNGRPYEPIFHFEADGEKRRSDVFRQAAVFLGAGPGCHEYMGHPTQKPLALMEKLTAKVPGVVADPFCGVGATLHAALRLSRRAIGIEIEERYCEIAAKRLAQGVLPLEAVR